VLKGAGSICAHTDGTWFINTTGNPGLASGGTGDVLSGIIASLMAQGLTALDAAKLGVYLHGAAADALLAEGLGPVGLTASEVALEVRNIINQLNACKSI
jgi:NAD(P)H-hydrate repair Nnr-like enzyme with NAD(P)H-hydrate dehydratase domain